MPKHKQVGLFRGAIIGLITGTAATVLMDVYWKVVKNALGERPEQKPKPGDDNQEKDEPSTQIIADKLSEAVTGEEIPEEGKAPAGVAVHYATGLMFGALFGAIAGKRPKWGLIAGLLYGAAIWLFFDELGLRAMNVAPDPRKVPPHEHLQALGAHLVYGAAMSILTKVLIRR
jgi:Protein of unknown function (DUF1440)